VAGGGWTCPVRTVQLSAVPGSRGILSRGTSGTLIHIPRVCRPAPQRNDASSASVVHTWAAVTAGPADASPSREPRASTPEAARSTAVPPTDVWGVRRQGREETRRSHPMSSTGSGERSPDRHMVPLRHRVPHLSSSCPPSRPSAGPDGGERLFGTYTIPNKCLAVKGRRTVFPQNPNRCLQCSPEYAIIGERSGR